MISASDLTKPVLKEIQDIEERTVAIAEDFPDELYNTYRPKRDPDVRTAAEILLHIAEQNESAASLIRTKPQQDALIASGRKRAAKDILTYVSKPDTVTKVKASFVAVRTAIEENPDPKRLEWWIYVIAQQWSLRKSGDLLPRERPGPADFAAIGGNGRPTLPETRNGMK
jgi:hypothetical protein